MRVHTGVLTYAPWLERLEVVQIGVVQSHICWEFTLSQYVLIIMINMYLVQTVSESSFHQISTSQINISVKCIHNVSSDYLFVDYCLWCFTLSCCLMMMSLNNEVCKCQVLVSFVKGLSLVFYMDSFRLQNDKYFIKWRFIVKWLTQRSFWSLRVFWSILLYHLVYSQWNHNATNKPVKGAWK